MIALSTVTVIALSKAKIALSTKKAIALHIPNRDRPSKSHQNGSPFPKN
jgi:hypothetical protein